MESAASVAQDVAVIVNESDSGIFIVPKRDTDTGKLRSQRREYQKQHIIKTMQQAYGLDDLRALCLDFMMDYESISGETRRDKIISFVEHFYKRNTLEVLTEFLEGDRENYNWRFDGKDGKAVG